MKPSASPVRNPGPPPTPPAYRKPSDGGASAYDPVTPPPAVPLPRVSLPRTETSNPFNDAAQKYVGEVNSKADAYRRDRDAAREADLAKSRGDDTKEQRDYDSYVNESREYSRSLNGNGGSDDVAE